MKLLLLHRFMVVIVFILLNMNSLFGGFKVEDVRTNIGDEFEIGFKFENNLDTFIRDIKFVIHLSNPTVVYLNEIIEEGYGIESKEIIRINDSSYTVRLIFSDMMGGYNEGSNLFSIRGTALAGNDSLCYLDFNNIEYLGVVSEDLQCKVISKTNDEYVQYIRNPKIRDLYPLPASSNDYLNCSFTIDFDADVEFKIFDTSGRFVKKHVLKGIKKGTHTISFFMEKELAMGTYFIALKTNKIYDQRKFIIIK